NRGKERQDIVDARLKERKAGGLKLHVPLALLGLQLQFLRSYVQLAPLRLLSLRDNCCPFLSRSLRQVLDRAVDDAACAGFGATFSFVVGPARLDTTSTGARGSAA
ncbi:unnamed protein product, partial [Tilletia controversa]